MGKVVIFGAGHGGLAVGARLAVKGHEVEIFELSSGPVTIPQTLTLPAAYRDLFLKTGSALEDNIKLQDVTTEQNIRFLALNDRDKTLWRQYISQVGDLWRGVRSKLIETHSDEPLWKIVGGKNLLKFRNFNKFTKCNLETQELRDLANSYKKQAYSKSNLGILTLNSYVQETFKVYEPYGGLSVLTDALYERCKQLGVKFHFNTIDSQDKADFVITNDFFSPPKPIMWTCKLSPKTDKERNFQISERSWLGLGPSHAVLTAEIVASLTIIK